MATTTAITTPQLKMAVIACDMTCWDKRASTAFLQTYSRTRGEDTFDYGAAVNEVMRLASKHQTTSVKTLFAVIDSEKNK